jgi:hypothetical protein
MRFDWFLPAIRRPQATRPEPKRYWIVRTLRRILPARFSSNWTTKQRGLVRNTLRKLGLSWLASPVRRMVQSASFLVFVILFFYVCWPYDASPARQWPGFVPVGVDPATGVASITHDRIPDDLLLDKSWIYISDASEEELSRTSLGPFKIAKSTNESMELLPIESIEEERRVAMALSPGPWTLSDQPLRAWPAHYAENLADHRSVGESINRRGFTSVGLVPDFGRRHPLGMRRHSARLLRISVPAGDFDRLV